MTTLTTLTISHSQRHLLITHGSLPVFAGVIKSPSRYKAIVRQVAAIAKPSAATDLHDSDSCEKVKPSDLLRQEDEILTHAVITKRLLQEGAVLPVWGSVDRMMKHYPELAEVCGWGEDGGPEGFLLKEACDWMETSYVG